MIASAPATATPPAAAYVTPSWKDARVSWLDPTSRASFVIDPRAATMSGAFSRPGVFRAFEVKLDGPTYAAEGARLLDALDRLAAAHLPKGEEKFRQDLAGSDPQEVGTVTIHNDAGGHALLAIDSAVADGPVREAIDAAKAILATWDAYGTGGKTA